jgi:hypothetical protein
MNGGFTVSGSFNLLFQPVANTLLQGFAGGWKFEEASGNRVDVLGVTHLTPTGSPGNAAGKIGNAVVLDGSTQWLSATGITWPGSPGYTVCGWAKFPSFTANRNLMEIADASTILYTYVQTITGPKLKLTVVDDLSNFVAVTANNAGNLATDTWYFVCVRVDYAAKAAKLQVNAAEDSVTTENNWPTPSNPTAFSLGANTAGGVKVAATLDEWYRWSRPLTDAEVAALYNGGLGLSYPF